jgi:hypothetical protein
MTDLVVMCFTIISAINTRCAFIHAWVDHSWDGSREMSIVLGGIGVNMYLTSPVRAQNRSMSVTSVIHADICKYMYGAEEDTTKID